MESINSSPNQMYNFPFHTISGYKLSANVATQLTCRLSLASYSVITLTSFQF